MLPIIQFKRISEFTNVPQKYSDLTQIPLSCKQCGNQKTYEIYESMMRQYQTGQFELFTERKTINEIMVVLSNQRSATSQIYWLRFKVNLDNFRVSSDPNFDGLPIDVLMAKRPKTARGERESRPSGVKYTFKMHTGSRYVDNYVQGRENNLYKLSMDLSEEIRNRYQVELGNWTFGFYYVNKSEQLFTGKVQYPFQGQTIEKNITISRDYIEYDQQSKPIKSIEQYLKKDDNAKYYKSNEMKFYHGSIRFKDVLTQGIAMQIYHAVLQEFAADNDYWYKQCTKYRKKGYNKMNYYWRSRLSSNHENLSPALRKQAEKVAGGLRWFQNDPTRRIIAPFIQALVPMATAVAAWDNTVALRQGSANLYFNPPTNTKPIYAELGCHNERPKFSHLTAFYINSHPSIKTGCCINLKSNTSNGVVLVNTNHLEIIKYDS